MLQLKALFFAATAAAAAVILVLQFIDIRNNYFGVLLPNMSVSVFFFFFFFAYCARTAQTFLSCNLNSIAAATASNFLMRSCFSCSFTCTRAFISIRLCGGLNHDYGTIRWTCVSEIYSKCTQIKVLIIIYFIYIEKVHWLERAFTKFLPFTTILYERAPAYTFYRFWPFVTLFVFPCFELIILCSFLYRFKVVFLLFLWFRWNQRQSLMLIIGPQCCSATSEIFSILHHHSVSIVSSRRTKLYTLIYFNRNSFLYLSW